MGKKLNGVWYLSFIVSLVAKFQTEVVGSGPVPFSCRVSSPGPLLGFSFLV